MKALKLVLGLALLTGCSAEPPAGSAKRAAPPVAQTPMPSAAEKPIARPGRETTIAKPSPIEGRYKLVAITFAGEPAPVEASGEFRFEGEKFHYTIFIDKEKVLEFGGDLWQVTPESFRFNYADFQLFIQRHHYTWSVVNGERRLVLNTPAFLDIPLEEALKKRNAPVQPRDPKLVLARQ